MKSEKQLMIEVRNGENVKENMEKLWLQYQPLINKIANKLRSWTHDYEDYLDFQNESYFALEKTVRSINLNKIDDNFHIVTILKGRLQGRALYYYRKKLRMVTNSNIYYENRKNRNIKINYQHYKKNENSDSDNGIFNDILNSNGDNKLPKEATDKLYEVLDEFCNSLQNKKFVNVIYSKVHGHTFKEYRELHEESNISAEWWNLNRKRLSYELKIRMSNEPLLVKYFNIGDM